MTSESGREMTERARQKRVAIATAAIAVFKANGYAAARLEDIAAAANVTKPTLYLYFDNKEEILKEAAYLGPSRCLPRMREVLEAHYESEWARLSDLIEALYLGIVEGSAGDMCSVIAETGTRFPHIAEHYRDRFILEIDGIVAGALEKGLANGEFRTAPLGGLLQLIIAPVVMHALTRSMFQDLAEGDPAALAVDKDAHVAAVRSLLLAKG